MPLNVIKGRYRILRSQPDGDSVHFYPDDLEAFCSKVVEEMCEGVHA